MVIANVAPTVADVSMSLNTLRYVTPLKIGQTNLEKVKINPENPANWDNEKLRNFVKEKTKGSIDPDLFCPFESGMQILRIPEAAFVQRILKINPNWTEKRHTSLKSKLAKNDFPEERTIYSESSRPGDFKNDLEIGLAYNVALNMY